MQFCFITLTSNSKTTQLCCAVLGSAQLELTDALHDYFFKYKRPVSQIQWNEKEDVYSDFQEKGAQFPKMLILLGAK